ncbi:MAG: YkgJ family cysteine cluster protein [Planctomycetota bacterium]|jgi:Fe-S-cluster containining protein
MSGNKDENKWYVGGLHFECMQCGNCCAGPDEGYIWVTKPEIEFMAECLHEPADQLWGKYIKRMGKRATIVEKPVSKDCVFLTETNGGRGCGIYHVRPNQCRTWPFWEENLAKPDNWNRAATKCSGINRGKLYTFEEIEKLRKHKSWWTDAD